MRLRGLDVSFDRISIPSTFLRVVDAIVLETFAELRSRRLWALRVRIFRISCGRKRLKKARHEENRDSLLSRRISASNIAILQVPMPQCSPARVLATYWPSGFFRELIKMSTRTRGVRERSLCIDIYKNGTHTTVQHKLPVYFCDCDEGSGTSLVTWDRGWWWWTVGCPGAVCATFNDCHSRNRMMLAHAACPRYNRDPGRTSFGRRGESHETSRCCREPSIPLSSLLRVTNITSSSRPRLFFGHAHFFLIPPAPLSPPAAKIHWLCGEETFRCIS